MASAGSITLNQSFYSDLVLGRVESGDQGFPWLEATVTKTATMELGSIMNQAQTEVASAGAADAFSVLVWSNVPLDLVAVGEEVVVVLAVRATTLNRKLLKFSNDVAVSDAAVDALEDRGLKITSKVYP